MAIISDINVDTNSSRMDPALIPQRSQPDIKPELAYAIKLANALHTRLNLTELIQLFSEEARHSVPHDGLLYMNADYETEVRVGIEAPNSCAYRLLIAGKNLGEIQFSRKKPFSESESVQMEYLLASLLNPLHNALMYKKALITAMQDPLTGLSNRVGFKQALERESDLAHRHQTPFALIMLDIDHFKSVNDNHGHLIGDCVLRDIAQACRDCVRSSDMLYRYGGEEFVLLLSNTTPEGAKLLAERIRRKIENNQFAYGETRLSATVSLGVANLTAQENGEQLLNRADKALYQAKLDGRNRVEQA